MPNLAPCIYLSIRLVRRCKSFCPGQRGTIRCNQGWRFSASARMPAISLPNTSRETDVCNRPRKTSSNWEGSPISAGARGNRLHFVASRLSRQSSRWAWCGDVELDSNDETAQGTRAVHDAAFGASGVAADADFDLDVLRNFNAGDQPQTTERDVACLGHDDLAFIETRQDLDRQRCIPRRSRRSSFARVGVGLAVACSFSDPCLNHRRCCQFS